MRPRPLAALATLAALALGCQDIIGADLPHLKPPVCGDGVVEGEEVCDDGNTDDCDACKPDCSAPLTGCGDGSVCGDEECDDGNFAADDGCFECLSECEVGNLPVTIPAETNGIVHTDVATNHCYVRVVNPRRGWSAARQHCLDWGGDLAVFESAAEQAAIAAAFPAPNSTWTAGNDPSAKGSFEWATGAPWTDDVTWGDGQPDQGPGTCIELLADGTLNDQVCNALDSFLCERDMTP